MIIIVIARVYSGFIMAIWGPSRQIRAGPEWFEKASGFKPFWSSSNLTTRASNNHNALETRAIVIIKKAKNGYDVIGLYEGRIGHYTSSNR